MPQAVEPGIRSRGRVRNSFARHGCFTLTAATYSIVIQLAATLRHKVTMLYTIGPAENRKVLIYRKDEYETHVQSVLGEPVAH
jgi:hypothetical protein